MRNILTIILVFISLSLFSQTTYYVSDSDGDDSNNGLTEAAAWKTLAKVETESGSFVAGDSILFKCGDRWFEELEIQAYGEEDNHITFSNYSTGDRPKLYGSIPVLGFTAHETYANVWRCDSLIDYDLYYGITGSSARASAFAILSDIDSVGWFDGYVDRETTFSGLTENWKWLWQNDSLYFYYDEDISNIDTLEVTQLARGFYIGDSSEGTGEYITIDGLSMKYWASRCIGTLNYPEVTKYGFQLRNCELAYTASQEEAVGYGVALAYSDMIIENNNIHNNGRRNISVNLVGTTGSAVMRNVHIRDNELYDGYHTTGVDMSMHSETQEIKDIHIYRNHIWDYYRSTNSRSESIFLQNYGGVAPTANYDSIYIYNNIIQNTTLDGVYMEYQGDHVYIINNTFTGGNNVTGGGQGTRAFVFNTSTDGHATVMNNLFINNDIRSVESFDGATDGTSILDTFDYNLNYTINAHASTYLWTDIPSSGGDLMYTEFSTLQGMGYEENSPDPSNPLMNDSIGITTVSAELKEGSPAISAATPVSFITTDFYENTRSVTPTIGAIEFGSSGIDSTATNILTFTIPNQVSSNVNSVDSSVAVVMPYGTDTTSLTPTITLSTGATISPLSGVTQGFTSSVNYTVTALNETDSQVWSVVVTNQSAPAAIDTIYFISGDTWLGSNTYIASGAGSVEPTPTTKRRALIIGGKLKVKNGKILVQ